MQSSDAEKRKSRFYIDLDVPKLRRKDAIKFIEFIKNQNDAEKIKADSTKLVIKGACKI